MKKLLIIEDSDSVRKTLRIAFGKQYEVTIAESGKEALELIFFFGVAYDLIITDIVLPDINGLDFIKKMREVNPHVPIIIITGYSSQETAEEAANLFISGYFKKPLNLLELKARVDGLLQKGDAVSCYPHLSLLISLSEKTKFHPITIKTIEEIHKKFQGKISLEDLSLTLGVSVFHLCRIFKKDCEMSIKQYINRLRLEVAKKLLRDTKYSILSVMELSGFRNRNYFFKYFNMDTGVTPKQFRDNSIIKDRKLLNHHALKPCVGWSIILFISAKITLFVGSSYLLVGT